MAAAPGTKSKVRFAISVDDQLRELFSVRETSKDDLIITIKPSLEANFGDLHSTVNERRYTVHPSRNSDNITINEHVTLGADSKIYSYSHIKPRRGRCLWPVAATICQSLRLDRHNLKGRKNDTIIDLGSYDPDLGTLFYLIIIDTLRVPLDLDRIPVKTVVQDFRSFRMIVGYGFMCLPSIHLGYSTRLANYSPKLNGKRVAPVADGPSLSPSPTLLIDYITRLMLKLSDRHYQRIINHFDEQADDKSCLEPEHVRMLAHAWTKEPVFIINK